MKKTVKNSELLKKFSSKELPRNQQKNIFGGTEAVTEDGFKPLGYKIGQTNTNSGSTL